MAKGSSLGSSQSLKRKNSKSSRANRNQPELPEVNGSDTAVCMLNQISTKVSVK